MFAHEILNLKCYLVNSRKGYLVQRWLFLEVVILKQNSEDIRHLFLLVGGSSGMVSDCRHFYDR